MNNFDDNKIWDSFLKGNEQAFNLIFKKFYEELFYYGVKITGNRDLVQDEIQQLFIKLWERKQKLPEVHSVKAYLLKAFRRQIIDSLKKQQKRQVIPLNKSIENNHYEFSMENSLINKQVSEERRKALQQAIEQLNPHQREILYLKFYNNLSYQEIAEVLAISYQTVRNYMSKALKLLRKKNN